MINAENVTYSYESEEQNDSIKIPVLSDVTLSIEKGSFVSILGHNGSGKSTLVKTFNSILLPDGGKIYVDNLDTSNEELVYEIRKKVGMVFQNPDNQLVATIVEEDIAFGPENLGVESAEIRKRVDEALNIVDMRVYAGHAPHMLSGGQKQRIAIAGVIAMQPEYIILDESTAMLDPKGRKDVMDTVKKLNKEYNMTVILITHYMEEAAESDRIIVLDSGKIVLDGKPCEVFSNVDKMKSLKLGVPQATELAYELKKLGIDFKTPLNADEFMENFNNFMEIK